jgi:hypothetical protein
MAHSMLLMKIMTGFASVSTMALNARKVWGDESRRKLYGTGLVVALLFLVVAQFTNGDSASVSMYLPLAGATMLLLCCAGAECHLYLQRVAREHEQVVAERGQSEQVAVARQRVFNQMWQMLADSRGQARAPEPVLHSLCQLFGADMVAVWEAGSFQRGFRLRGLLPADEGKMNRLDTIGRHSPCFDVLIRERHVCHLKDSADDLSPGLGWFCEENQFRHVVMCPVLVRQELVGVLTLFYRNDPKLTSKSTEEMQSAANLFLCAL